MTQGWQRNGRGMAEGWRRGDRGIAEGWQRDGRGMAEGWQRDGGKTDTPTDQPTPTDEAASCGSSSQHVASSRYYQFHSDASLTPFTFIDTPISHVLSLSRHLAHIHPLPASKHPHPDTHITCL